MSRPSFVEGIVLALIVSIAASFSYAVMTWVLSGFGAVQLLITMISFSYVLYLLIRSDEKIGRVVVMCVWVFVACSVWVLDVPLSLFCLSHLMMTWIVRSLYYYASIVSSLIDFALISLSLLFSTWAFYQTGGVFISIWSFFLMQSLFVWIPVQINPLKKTKSSKINGNEFNQAFKNANVAIQKLTTSR